MVAKGKQFLLIFYVYPLEALERSLPHKHVEIYRRVAENNSYQLEYHSFVEIPVKFGLGAWLLLHIYCRSMYLGRQLCYKQIWAKRYYDCGISFTSPSWQYTCCVTYATHKQQLIIGEHTTRHEISQTLETTSLPVKHSILLYFSFVTGILIGYSAVTCDVLIYGILIINLSHQVV